MTDLFTPTDDKSEIAAYVPGEENRYKSIEDLAKGAYEKDRHIKQIEQENKDLRESNLMLRTDNMAKAKLEEYVDKITHRPSEGNNPPPVDVTPFDPNTIEPLFEKKIKEYEASKTREQNVKFVVDALKERYGHNYTDALNKQSEELGLTREAVNYLAETSPKALMKQLGLMEAPRTDPFAAPPRRSPFFAPKPEEKRTWSYYQKLRQEKPSVFNNPQTQVQMQKDYMTYGKDFEDGDFLAYGQESAF